MCSLYTVKVLCEALDEYIETHGYCKYLDGLGSHGKRLGTFMSQPAKNLGKTNITTLHMMVIGIPIYIDAI